jgi:hypothetical protein
MTRRSFLIQAATLALALVALNIAIARLSVNSVPRQLLRAIAASPPVSVIFAGNSLIAAGIDTPTYEQASGGGRALNIALGSSSPIEHDLLLRRALRLRPGRVVYGFFNAQLTRPAENTWTDLFGNRAMVFYVEPATAIRLIAGGDRWRALQFRLLAHVPMFVERAAIWARVEKWRRRMSDVGVPATQAARFGQVGDFANIEPLDPAAFRQYCASAVAGHAPLLPAVADMLEQSRQNGAAVVVVEMPQPARLRARFYETAEWTAYREHLVNQVQRLGATYVDASDWMADDAFEDGIHLSVAGARAFSMRLATASSGT